MDRDMTVNVPMTLREVAALQVLAISGVNNDPETIGGLAERMETALEEFRKALGTKRFAAHLKSGWRRQGSKAAATSAE
jgi:hypothetical protein